MIPMILDLLWAFGPVAYNMRLSILFNCIILLICVVFTIIAAVKIRYISTEHPAVTYLDNKYITYANLTSRRHGRGDPFYYVDLHIYFVYQFNNNISIHFYFYEFLSNEYKRGFVEMHVRMCDLIHKDKFFGSALKQGKFDQPCPFPAGEYNLYNMTIPLEQIPRNFPFTKGRIYCNLTVTRTQEIVAAGYIDMEIKEAHVKRTKKN